MQHMDHGPITRLVSASVARGQVVMADAATGLVKPATAGTTLFLGVARDDAAPDGSGSATNLATLRPEVAIFQAPAIVEVTFAADTDDGEFVVCAAAGAVTPVGAAAASDATSVVGKCVDPGGVTAGNKGLLKLR